MEVLVLVMQVVEEVEQLLPLEHHQIIMVEMVVMVQQQEFQEVM
tara:strand:- start:150 stop:281 length:132 start_codon:yes stop_codon:yes gene_type:complete